MKSVVPVTWLVLELGVLCAQNTRLYVAFELRLKANLLGAAARTGPSRNVSLFASCIVQRSSHCNSFIVQSCGRSGDSASGL